MSELVDHERAWLHLRAHIRTKRSHGARELLEVMTDLEVESMYGPEGAPKSPDARPLSDEAGGDAPSDETPSSEHQGDDPSWTQVPPPAVTPSPSATEPSSSPLRAVASA